MYLRTGSIDTGTILVLYGLYLLEREKICPVGSLGLTQLALLFQACQGGWRDRLITDTNTLTHCPKVLLNPTKCSKLVEKNFLLNAEKTLD